MAQCFGKSACCTSPVTWVWHLELTTWKLSWSQRVHIHALMHMLTLMRTYIHLIKKKTKRFELFLPEWPYYWLCSDRL